MVEEFGSFSSSLPRLKDDLPPPPPLPMKGILPFGIAISRMCGEIDEEITVPELVKEDTLCPHQTMSTLPFQPREEQEQLDAFSQQKNALLQQLTSDPLFCQYLQTCQALSGQISDYGLLNEPKYLSATLIFLRSKGIVFPKRFQDLLGAKNFLLSPWTG